MYMWCVCVLFCLRVFYVSNAIGSDVHVSVLASILSFLIWNEKSKHLFIGHINTIWKNIEFQMKESIEFLVSARFSSYTAGFFFEHIFFMRTHHHFFSRSHGTMDHSMVAVYMGFWAAAPKGRCPVEHRGEYPYVCTSFLPTVPPPSPSRPSKA